MPGRDGKLQAKEEAGSGWVWIGFDGEPMTDFPVLSNAIGAALIGMRRGAVASFRAAPAGPPEFDSYARNVMISLFPTSKRAPTIGWAGAIGWEF